jgi:hypothetical protein
MQLNLLNILLLLVAAYYLVGVTFKPAFFWERGRILRTRNIIGDQKTLILYTVLAFVMIAVALFNIFR